MSIKKIERLKFASTLRKDLYEKLQKESEETDIPISKLFDRAVETYFQSKKESSEK